MLCERLDNYEENHWDFVDYRNKEAIIKYPAMMVAPMQEQLLLDILAEDRDISNMLDPFMGSGTSLLAGINSELDVYGIDINPLAVLISQVNLEGIEINKIYEGVRQLKSYMALYNGNSRWNFTNIQKWFRSDVIEDLSTIKCAIEREENPQLRRFFWVCFSDTVKKYSNTRSTTFKLHIKQADKIDGMQNTCIEHFFNKIISSFKYYQRRGQPHKVNLFSGDSSQVLSRFKSNSIDLICTSPPYGDNHTTVTYGQFSILPLLWINSKDLEFYDENILNRFTYIDRISLGGSVQKSKNHFLYDDLLLKISDKKAQKVISFFEDYILVFEQMVRVLKQNKLIVLTLGNRRVDNQEILFNILNDRLAEKFGLKKEYLLTRNIQGKRMPLKVSKVKDLGAVKSMSKEYIVIYRKL